MKYYIDFSARNGFRYMLVDAGWAPSAGAAYGAGRRDSDLTKFKPQVDIPKLVEYAKSVSYTHLDVYKRQSLDRFPRCIPPGRIVGEIAGKLLRVGPDTHFDEAPDESNALPITTVHKVISTKSASENRKSIVRLDRWLQPGPGDSGLSARPPPDPLMRFHGGNASEQAAKAALPIAEIAFAAGGSVVLPAPTVPARCRVSIQHFAGMVAVVS